MLNVVLYQPEIPPNTGNIARLCAGAGAKLHLIKPLGFDIDDKAVRRAGLDYWDKVDLKVWDSWDIFYNEMKGTCHGKCLSSYYLTTKTDKKYTDVRFKKGDYLIFGPETKGLPEDMLAENKENTITIPMIRENVRSLNLSNSVAVVLYEAIRQNDML